jgi:hypothetical protein
MAWTRAKKITAGLAVLLLAGVVVVLVLRYHRQYHGPSHFPKGAWADAGTRDPVSALESAAYAAAQGDGKTLLASLTPELQAAVHRAWAMQGKAKGLSEEDFLAADARRYSPSILGFRVLGEQVVKPDQVRLLIYVQGWWYKMPVALKRIGNEWKIAGFR